MDRPCVVGPLDAADCEAGDEKWPHKTKITKNKHGTDNNENQIMSNAVTFTHFAFQSNKSCHGEIHSSGRPGKS